MNQLKATLENALSGRGLLVMIAGEPGIDKTRLAGEFGLHAGLRGAQVLASCCYEGERAPPTGPASRPVAPTSATVTRGP